MSMSMSMSMGELVADTKTDSMRNDAAAYNEFASAAVDLSDAHVSKDGLFTGTVNMRRDECAFAPAGTY
jgi:hypothetical protein